MHSFDKTKATRREKGSLKRCKLRTTMKFQKQPNMSYSKTADASVTMKTSKAQRLRIKQKAGLPLEGVYETKHGHTTVHGPILGP